MAYDLTPESAGLRTLFDTALETDLNRNQAADDRTSGETGSAAAHAAPADEVLGDGLVAADEAVVADPWSWPETDGSPAPVLAAAAGIDTDLEAAAVSVALAEAPVAVAADYETMAGCSCPTCADAGSFAATGGALDAPAPAASIQTLANYLTSGYWTGSGLNSRYFNLTNSGTGANGDTLYYNYSGFSGTRNGYADGNGVSAARQTLIDAAFDFYGELMGVNFVQTASDADHVDFFFIDNVYTSTGGQRAFNSSNVHLNWLGGGPIDYNVINITPGWHGSTSNIGGTSGYTYQTVLHEIGHGLGLGHQGAYNAAPGVSITYNNHAIWANDSWQQTMMSYFDQVENTSISASYAHLVSPMAVDFLALDALYASQGNGISNAFNGNTIYGVGTNIGSMPGYGNLAALADTNAFGLVDGSGIDTVDFSNYGADQTIDLRLASAASSVGTISSVGGLTGNMTIAVGTVIENATSGWGDDRLYGNQYNNTLIGNGGNDTIYGGDGYDRMYGGTGDDRIYGGSGTNYYYGGSGSNYHYGGADSDYVYSGTNYDVLYSGAGTSGFYGGAGGTNLHYGGSGANYHYGGAGYDYLNAGDGNDYFYGGNGNDQFYGGGGDDYAYGGDGNDLITGGDGIDRMYGGDGNDYFYFDGGDNWGSETISGGAGIDTLSFSNIGNGVSLLGFDVDAGYSFSGGAYSGTWSGLENIIGSAYRDVITGNSFGNTLYGGDNDDTLIGEGGNDVLYGGAGNDRIEDGSGGDTVYGGDGDDLFIAGDSSFGNGDAWYGGAGTDTLNFSAFSWTVPASTPVVFDFENGELSYNGFTETVSSIEIFQGSQGNETIVSEGVGGTYFGNGGDDIMVAEIGAETLYGGAGIDTLDTRPFNGAYDVNLQSGLTNYGSELYLGFENAILGNGNDTLTGNGSANVLEGGGGNDTIYGGSARDTIYGGDGDDLMVYVSGEFYDDFYGGAGTDTVELQTFSADRYVANLATGVFTTLTTATTWALEEIENVTSGDNDDFLFGNGGSNLLDGGSGDDYVLGFGGDDTLYGGDGDDTVDGGAGADVMFGGAGVDTLRYYGPTGVNVFLFNNTAAGGYATGDSFSGFENLTGGDGGDFLVGDGGSNVIDGGNGGDILMSGGGADTVHGGLGDDTVRGGAGADTMDGGADTDTLSYYDDIAGVDVYLFNGFAAGGDAAGDSFAGFENLQGGSGDDFLIGDGGANRLQGGDGDDTLRGGNGADILIGGTDDDILGGDGGGDSFVFADGFGDDRIIDFATAVAGEVIDLSAVSAITGWADLSANHLSATVGGALIMQGVNTIFIEGVAAASLSAGDFVF